MMRKWIPYYNCEVSRYHLRHAQSSRPREKAKVRESNPAHEWIVSEDSGEQNCSIDGHSVFFGHPASILSSYELRLTNRVLDRGELRLARPAAVERHELPSAQERCGEEDRVLAFFGHKGFASRGGTSLHVGILCALVAFEIDEHGHWYLLSKFPPLHLRPNDLSETCDCQATERQG